MRWSYIIYCSAMCVGINLIAHSDADWVCIFGGALFSFAALQLKDAK